MKKVDLFVLNLIKEEQKSKYQKDLHSKSKPDNCNERVIRIG